jgi:hypothetical protein
MKAFPFAESRPGMMQLRVAAQLPLPTMLLNLPRIWTGEFTHPDLLDFHAERISVQFDRPVPLHVGGDAEGWRSHVMFGMSTRGVELVDYKQKPAVRQLKLLH